MIFNTNLPLVALFLYTIHTQTHFQAVLLNKICKTEIGNVYLNSIYLSVAVGISLSPSCFGCITILYNKNKGNMLLKLKQQEMKKDAQTIEMS